MTRTLVCIALVDATGRVVREAGFRTRAHAVSAAERDSLVGIVWHAIGSTDAGSRQDYELTGLVDTLFADRWPAVTDAAASRGEHGHIWIELAGPRERPGRTWLLLDRDFEPVGRVHVPLALEYVLPFDREIWGTARLEDGVAVIAGFVLDSIDG